MVLGNPKKRVSIKSFEDLDCWKACRTLRLFVIREMVPLLPASEKLRLVDQLLRSARSTTANVAEGYGRYNFMDNRKFVGIARGSCFEVMDHMITAHDEGMISDELLAKGRSLAQEAIRLLNGYMAYLKRADQSPSLDQ
jgi:four helix bundle protein